MGFGVLPVWLNKPQHSSSPLRGPEGSLRDRGLAVYKAWVLTQAAASFTLYDFLLQTLSEL